MNLFFLKHLRLFWWPFIVFTIIVTTIVVSDNILWKNVLILSFSLCLTASFACLHNDLIDQECDRINQNNGKGHFIQKTNKNIINLLLIIFFLAPLFLAGSVSPRSFIFILIILSALLIYNYLKYLSPVSILLSSASSLSPIFLPVIFWSNNPSSHLVPIVSILMLVISREVIADIYDDEGDKRAGKKTMPVIIGREKSYWIAFGLAMLSLISLLINAYFFKQINPVRILIYISFTIFISVVTIKARRWKNKDNLKSYINLTRFTAIIVPFLFL